MQGGRRKRERREEEERTKRGGRKEEGGRRRREFVECSANDFPCLELVHLHTIYECANAIILCTPVCCCIQTFLGYNIDFFCHLFWDRSIHSQTYRQLQTTTELRSWKFVVNQSVKNNRS